MEFYGKIDGGVIPIVYKKPTSGYFEPKNQKKNSKFLKLKNGEIVYGKILNKIDEDIAEVSIPIGTFRAQIHKNLIAGDELFFMVEQSETNLLLKVYSLQVFFNSKIRSIQEIMRILDFGNNNHILEIVNYYISFKNTIIRDEVLSIYLKIQSYLNNSTYQSFSSHLIRTFYWLNESKLITDNIENINKIFIDWNNSDLQEKIISKFNNVNNIITFSSKVKNLVLSIDQISVNQEDNSNEMEFFKHLNEFNKKSFDSSGLIHLYLTAFNRIICHCILTYRNKNDKKLSLKKIVFDELSNIEIPINPELKKVNFEEIIERTKSIFFKFGLEIIAVIVFKDDREVNTFSNNLSNNLQKISVVI